MSDARKKILLKQSSVSWWQLVTTKGIELTEPVQYGNKEDAITWATAWVSSFNNVELVIKDDYKKN